MLFNLPVLERDVQSEVGAGVGRNLATDTARADEACLVAAVACAETVVAHRPAHSGVVVVELGAAVVPHVAREDAPVRSKVDLEETCHPVTLVVLGAQILEFETARELRGPFVEQVSHHDMRRADIEAVAFVVLVIFLHRERKSEQRRKRIDCLHFALIDHAGISFYITKAPMT